MPTTGQLGLLIIAAALVAVSGATSVARAWRDGPMLAAAARAGLIAALGCCAAVLAWHAAQRGRWVPIGDNFDALIWLATLLAAFVLYVQATRRLGAIDWFVLPIVLLLLVAAAVLGRVEYHDYVGSAWDWVHRVTAYGGAVAFAVAAASGAMYVLVSRRLRSKAPVGPHLGSLERLEHLTMTSVTLGFALLTLGAITGGISMMAGGKHTPTAKVVLALAVWIVYGLVLHAPINPSFRGRRAAVLSVVGFFLMIGTIVAVQVLPET